MTTKLISSFAIGGYRSFGDKVQYFECLGDINILIGRNNSGKSNMLRAIDEVYPQILRKDGRIQLSDLEKHQPTAYQFTYGVCFPDFEQGANEEGVNRLFSHISDGHQHRLAKTILTAFINWCKLTGHDKVWFYYGVDHKLAYTEPWSEAFNSIPEHDIAQVWNRLTGRSGGSKSTWITEIIGRIAPTPTHAKTIAVPAIREITRSKQNAKNFSGAGIIDQLARFQNPPALNQSEREKFEKIQNFLRTVLDDFDATIEVPFDRDTIVVHMNGKSLPIESLGSGIHEVIVLAAASTVHESTVVCLEEPELHLNPILLRKLIRYLKENTSNQYFISTHSPILMDAKDVEIFHFQLIEGQSIVDRIESSLDRSVVCENLGYHPSDLLQANCILWVEGPSDRIYLNFWISHKSPGLIEGIDYSIMFYGGRLLSHLSNEEDDSMVKEFISLRKLNRRSAILIDSDKKAKKDSINATKTRILAEFKDSQSFAWVTFGREIENYITPSAIIDAVKSIHPKAAFATQLGTYDNCLKLKNESQKTVFDGSKTAVAKWIVQNTEPNYSRFNLDDFIDRLIGFISSSNPNQKKKS